MISSPDNEAGVRMQQIVEALSARNPVGVLRSAEHEAACQIEVRRQDMGPPLQQQNDNHNKTAEMRAPSIRP